MSGARTATLIGFGVLAALLLPAVPAHAGGPTSVLLAAPGASATGLYHTDPEYDELRRLVGIAPADGAATSSRGDSRPEAADRIGPYVTVTWLIHDVHVWRVDRIYYEAPGGPWIYTETDELNQAAAREWRTSDDPDRLVRLLAELGLTGSDRAGPVPPPPPEPAGYAAGGSAGEGAAEDSAEAAGAGDAVSVQPAADTDSTATSAVSPWWWTTGGLVAGLLLAAGGAAAWSSRRDADGPPAQELVDL